MRFEAQTFVYVNVRRGRQQSGFHIGYRAVIFWADIQNFTIGFNVKF